ncbi:MAG: argininosuccinate lyase [Anaerolineae bacterium]
MAHPSEKFPHPIYEKVVLQPFFRDAAIYYYEPMLAANRAHVVMLHHCGIITQENAQALLGALAEVERLGIENLGYESGVEDLFFTIERKLIEIAGQDYGGNLQLARSRNDLGYALTRLALRPRLLATMQHLLQFREALLRLAEQHTETIMPGYTHTQPAQPTTLAHYLAGMLAVLERDFRRVRFAYDTNNQSPLGAAALTGTGFPIDRALSAELLGFSGVMQSTYDSIGASDNLTDTALALTSLGINLSRFTRDMLFWATRESGAIRIDDSFIQISSIMPQKRNPVVLEHLRARLSRMVSYANGVVLQCHNIPFGDTQDIEDEIFPPLFGSLETASEALSLYTVVIDTLQVNVAHLAQRAAEGFTTVTELADTLVREAGLPFRQAHHMVSNMISHALTHQLGPDDLGVDLLNRIARETLGMEIRLPEDSFRRALDPVAFVRARKTLGGAAPEATRQILAQQSAALQADRDWMNVEEDRLGAAASRLTEATLAIR